MRIIGIDPGLARVGYGIIEIINNKKVKIVPIKDKCSEPTPKSNNGFAKIQPNI